MPAIAATGVKTLSNGRTEVNLAANPALAKVGAVIELNIKKYGRVAVVRTSKSAKGFSVFNLPIMASMYTGAVLGMFPLLIYIRKR
jgi:hypothetical protein